MAVHDIDGGMCRSFGGDRKVDEGRDELGNGERDHGDSDERAHIDGAVVIVVCDAGSGLGMKGMRRVVTGQVRMSRLPVVVCRPVVVRM